nr:MAG TPA: GCN4-pII/Tumor necrosis factor ligand superfamily, Glucocorticoid-Induced TNF Receptor Ligand.95A [Caudoviricetes sp.]
MMSRVTELEEKAKELMKEIETLKQEKIEEFEYPFKRMEQYCFIDNDGKIIESAWTNHNLDICRYEQGNIFKTEKEALRERDKRTLLTRFRQFRDKCNRDWKPTINEKKYYIFFNFEEHKFKVDWFRQIGIFESLGVFKNKEDCDRAIELFGDEIKRLYLEW